MLPSLISRNVVVSGQRTSFRLEPEMWSALDLICQQEEIDVHSLCTWISTYKPRSNRTSAIRAFIVSYLRSQLETDADNKEAHANDCPCSDEENLSKNLCRILAAE